MAAHYSGAGEDQTKMTRNFYQKPVLKRETPETGRHALSKSPKARVFD